PYRDGFARITALRDITARREAERELRRQALIFENLHDALVITDLGDHIVDWNPAAEVMFGYCKEEALGRTSAQLLGLRPTGTVSGRMLDGMLRDGRWSGPVHFQHKDGSEGTSETVLIPLPDASGRPSAAAGVHRD